MTRISPEDCTVCGGPLIPPELTSGFPVIAGTDYICLGCRTSFRWTTENPPRLTVLTSQKSSLSSGTGD